MGSGTKMMGFGSDSYYGNSGTPYNPPFSSGGSNVSEELAKSSQQ
jgi:hypothetical protein